MRLVQCVLSHLEVSLISLLVCLLIGIPLGIICSRSKALAQIVLSLANFMKVIPSLAIMITLLPIVGAGMKTAVIALILLGLPPIMVNTCLGIRNIDPHIIEAAQGIGMDRRTILFKIQIPLSFPMMLTGIRTSAVMLVACATLAYYIGGGGLGSAIHYGIAMHIMPILILSSIGVAVMTAGIDLIFARLQKRVDKKYSI